MISDMRTYRHMEYCPVHQPRSCTTHSLRGSYSLLSTGCSSFRLKTNEWDSEQNPTDEINQLFRARRKQVYFTCVLHFILNYFCVLFLLVVVFLSSIFIHLNIALPRALRCSMVKPKKNNKFTHVVHVKAITTKAISRPSSAHRAKPKALTDYSGCINIEITILNDDYACCLDADDQAREWFLAFGFTVCVRFINELFWTVDFTCARSNINQANLSRRKTIYLHCRPLRAPLSTLISILSAHTYTHK